MKLELFSCPFFIGNIDLKQIKFDPSIGRAWLSQTPSSAGEDNYLPPESTDYLLSVIDDLLREKYQHFTLTMLGIWRNEYLNNDFQEPHIHTGAQFSFIIYEEVVTPHTIFFNPAKYLIWATLGQDKNVVEELFIPQARKGQIIVFPSYVEHMVNKNSDQVTITGNLNFKLEHREKEPESDSTNSVKKKY